MRPGDRQYQDRPLTASTDRADAKTLAEENKRREEQLELLTLERNTEQLETLDLQVRATVMTQ